MNIDKNELRQLASELLKTSPDRIRVEIKFLMIDKMALNGIVLPKKDNTLYCIVSYCSTKGLKLHYENIFFHLNSPDSKTNNEPLICQYATPFDAEYSAQIIYYKVSVI